jgi:uncharacterized membrane protein
MAEAVMNEQDEAQERFFNDLGAGAQQTVQQVRGSEENYYSLIHGAIRAFPWLDDFNKKLQTYLEQNFAAASEFALELSQARNMQDFTRIHTAYIQKCLQSFTAQMTDFSATYLAGGALKTASLGPHG